MAPSNPAFLPLSNGSATAMYPIRVTKAATTAPAPPPAIPLVNGHHGGDDTKDASVHHFKEVLDIIRRQVELMHQASLASDEARKTNVWAFETALAAKDAHIRILEQLVSNYASRLPAAGENGLDVVVGHPSQEAGGDRKISAVKAMDGANGKRPAPAPAGFADTPSHSATGSCNDSGNDSGSTEASPLCLLSEGDIPGSVATGHPVARGGSGEDLIDVGATAIGVPLRSWTLEDELGDWNKPEPPRRRVNALGLDVVEQQLLDILDWNYPVSADTWGDSGTRYRAMEAHYGQRGIPDDTRELLGMFKYGIQYQPTRLENLEGSVGGQECLDSTARDHEEQLYGTVGRHGGRRTVLIFDIPWEYEMRDVLCRVRGGIVAWSTLAPSAHSALGMQTATITFATPDGARAFLAASQVHAHTPSGADNPWRVVLAGGLTYPPKRFLTAALEKGRTRCLVLVKFPPADLPLLFDELKLNLLEQPHRALALEDAWYDTRGSLHIHFTKVEEANRAYSLVVRNRYLWSQHRIAFAVDPCAGDVSELAEDLEPASYGCASLMEFSMVGEIVQYSDWAVQEAAAAAEELTEQLHETPEIALIAQSPSSDDFPDNETVSQGLADE